MVTTIRKAKIDEMVKHRIGSWEESSSDYSETDVDELADSIVKSPERNAGDRATAPAPNRGRCRDGHHRSRRRRVVDAVSDSMRRTRPKTIQRAVAETRVRHRRFRRCRIDFRGTRRSGLRCRRSRFAL